MKKRLLVLFIGLIGFGALSACPRAMIRPHDDNTLAITFSCTPSEGDFKMFYDTLIKKALFKSKAAWRELVVHRNIIYVLRGDSQFQDLNDYTKILDSVNKELAEEKQLSIEDAIENGIKISKRYRFTRKIKKIAAIIGLPIGIIGGLGLACLKIFRENHESQSDS